jgi:hypothetical protein
LALVASFATSYFATPTVFGGRDQGSLAIAAINLAKQGSFNFSTPESRDLFKKYGPGKALNYPGFDYTKNGDLETRFPKAYVAYLAAHFKFFGLKGIQYANFLPLFLFLLFFWLLLKKFFPESVSFFGFLLAASFFPFMWFAKYALTETLALSLVWIGIYFLISCRHRVSTNIDVRCLQIALVVFALSALVRIEGIAFFLLAAIYILILNRKKIITLPKNFYKYLSISTLLLLILYLYLNFPTLFDSLKNIAKAFLPNSTKDSVPSANLYAYIFRVFFNYNIFVYLVLGLIGIVGLLKDIRKNFAKPEFAIVFVFFPAFFYLITPQITLDDPWLLRRFVFAVFPALIFFSIYALNRFFVHRIFLFAVLAGLLVANVAVSSRFITLSENKGLLDQVEKISERFGPKDLVLVDRMATGSGYSLASEPMSALFGKNAVYFFNAADLEFIDQKRYENIYLIAPPNEENSWFAGLVKDKKPIDLKIIDNNFLEPSEKKWSLAENVESQNFALIWEVK